MIHDVDGPETKKLVSYIISLGEYAVSIAGNHEWVLRNSLSRYPLAKRWQEELWPHYHRNVLESYNCENTRRWSANATTLRSAMKESGHLEWLNNLDPYFETKDFAAIHAGPLLTIPWEQQKKYFATLEDEVDRLIAQPPQLFNFIVANRRDYPDTIDDTRMFITSHAHKCMPSGQRIGAHHIRLASKIHRGEPLYVWRNDEARIIEYPQ